MTAQAIVNQLLQNPDAIEAELATRSLRWAFKRQTTYEPPAFVIKIMEVLETQQRVMLLLPPGHNKSTSGQVYQASYMGNNPTKDIISVSYSKDLALQFSTKIKDYVASERWPFRHVKLDKDTSAKALWKIEYEKDGRWEKGGQYRAASLASPITGFRADLIIIDDPFKSKQEASSPLMQQNVMDYYKTVLMTRLKPGGSVFLINTRWHVNDLSGQLLPEDYSGQSGLISCRDGQTWYVVNLPAEAERADDLMGRNHGDPLWPDVYTKEVLEERAKALGSMDYAALYQQRPTLLSGNLFKDRYRQYYDPFDPQFSPKNMNIYIMCDAANSKTKTSDYTSFFVWGLSSDNNMYWLDAVHDKLNPKERVDALFELHMKWNGKGSGPPIVGYEEYAMQSDMFWIQEQMKVRNYRFQLIQLKGRLKKEERINRLLPFWEDYRIFLPKFLEKMRIDGSRVELVQYGLDELALFPFAPHDDMWDSASRIFDDDINMRFPRIAEYDPPAKTSDDFMDW